MANVFAAMAPIFWAIASCLPMARPHCTRSLAHWREISRQRLPAATEEMGSVSRPVLRVIRPSFKPLPTSHSTRSEEHTSELQSHSDLVCRLLLEKKKKNKYKTQRRHINTYRTQ